MGFVLFVAGSCLTTLLWRQRAWQTQGPLLPFSGLMTTSTAPCVEREPWGIVVQFLPHAPSPPPFAVAAPRGDAAGHGFMTLHSPPPLCAVVPGRCGDGGGCQVHQGAAVRPATCRHVRVPHMGPRVLRACVGAGVPLPHVLAC